MKNEPVVTTPRQIFRPHASMGWSLNPNAKVMPTFRKNIIQTTDQEGWRKVVGQPATPKSTIAFYGCSFTYGTGLKDEETFTSLLQHNFPQVCILNRGVGGHGTIQNYIQLRKDVREQAVDAAVFCFISDHRYRNICHPIRMKAHLSPQWYEIGVEHIPRAVPARNGKIEIEYISIWQPSLFKNDFNIFLPPEYYIDYMTIESLKMVQKFAYKRDIPLKIVLLDSIDPILNSRILEEIDGVVDISTPYDLLHTFQPDDLHPNFLANQLFAERLLPVVKSLI